MSRLSKIKLISDATCRVPENSFAGSSHGKGKAACACIVIDPVGNVLDQRAKYLGELTAPQAEYEGLVFALDTAVEFCRQDVEVWMDSELVIRHLIGDYCLRSDALKLLYDEVKKRESRFLGKVCYFHHSRGSFWGRQADALANAEYSRNHTG